MSESWRWLDNNTLVADHGKRPVVLMARVDLGAPALLTRDETSGLLVPLEKGHPIARIIAAAPELLAACLKASVFVECIAKTMDVDEENTNITLNIIRDALSKARGE